jgi:hypothetical protein
MNALDIARTFVSDNQKKTKICPGNSFCNYLSCKKQTSMSIQNLSAGALRTVVIHEMRKFALALEYGSTVSDLEEIREHINEMTEVLKNKEMEEESKIAG